MRNLELLFLAWLVLLPLLLVTNVRGQAKPNCTEKCGNVRINYPFGMGSSKCYLNETFKVNCDNGMPTLANADLKKTFNISEIRLPNQIRLESSRIMAVDCTYTLSPNFTHNVSFEFAESFSVSARANRFRAMGCDTTAYINNTDGSFTSRCETEWMMSSEGGGRVKHGGMGQCQIAVTYGSRGFLYHVTDQFDYARSACWRNCSYAVLAEEEFEFSKEVFDSYLDLQSEVNESIRFPLRVEWAIPNQVGSCVGNKSNYCGQHAWCNYTASASGYNCYCNEGFEGNPYLNGTAGCGNGNTGFPTVLVALAGGAVLAATLGAASYSYGSWAQKKAVMKLTSKIVEELQNTGDFSPPDAEIDAETYDDVADPSSIDDVGDPDDVGNPDDPNTGDDKPKNFDEQDLKKAIKLGQKGRGLAIWASRRRVARANLPGKGPVEIRKYTVQERDQFQLRKFVRGVRTLSRIVKPPNISKLLGISTRERSLIYRQFSDRTLRDSLRGNPSERPSWEERLKVAVGTARGLAFAHSKGIYHGNVKSSNILLDDRCNSKLVEFGVVRLLRKNTLLNSSRGYVDPEYMGSGTNELTWFMDVYSFGVLLVELITGQDPSSKSFNRRERSLAMVFLTAVDKGQLEEMVDNCIWAEERKMELLGVAEIAKECLQQGGKGRPKILTVRDRLLKWAPRGPSPQGGQPANAAGSGPDAGQNIDWQGGFENWQCQAQSIVVDDELKAAEEPAPEDGNIETENE